LVYCRSMADFIRLAGPIGRFLLFRCGPFMIVDATGRIKNLAGRYHEDRNPRYFKGPAQPALGDLSDTELVLFGP
jgi:hypothetical protein